MPNDFQQTVDLSEKLAHKSKSFEKPQKIKKIIRHKRIKRNAEEIDEVFNDNEDVEPRSEMQKISRPEIKSKSNEENVYKKISAVLFLSLALVFIYFIFFNEKAGNNPAAENAGATGWYSVKLLNNEMYYGQIADLSSDPVIIKNVYYNYDQINKEADSASPPQEGGNLRLVKRGKETHGGDGTLSIVRSQVVLMEPLKEDSKVLKAILDYEK